MKDTGKAKLPGLVSPRVDSADLARWVQAVSERLEVREGTRGNPYERAVTVRDLTEGGIAAIGGGGRIAAIGGGTQSPGTYDGSANPDYEKFWAELKNSSLYRELMKRLDDPTRFDDLAEEVKAVLLRDIAEEARLRGADIQRLDTKIQTETRSLAMSVQEVTAAVQQAAAGVRDTQFAQASANEAIAGRITQVQAKLDDKVAAVEQVLKTTADSVNGLKAEYYVKVEAGGAFGGFGLSAEAPVDPSKPSYSQFLIAADKFALVNPNGIKNPFSVDANAGIITLNGQVRINAKPIEDLNNEFYLTATGQVFNQNPNTNALSPASITITANRKGTIATNGTVSFTSAPAGLVTNNGNNTATVQSSALSDNASVKVTASLTHNEIDYSDEFTIYRVQDGADALVGFLTNESHSLPADEKGAVSSYTGASGEFVVFKGGVKQTEGVTFDKVSSAPSGLTADISSTGAYSVTGGLTSDVATVTFSATIGGQTLNKVFTLTRQKQGATGNYTDYIFKRSASEPVSAPPVGWSDMPPAGTDPLYMSQAVKKPDGTLIGSWSTPVRLDGKPGTDGKYTIYQYTTGTEIAATGAWQSTPPALKTGEFMWMRAGEVTPPATTPAAWGTPYRVSGETGPKGNDGPRGPVTGSTALLPNLTPGYVLVGDSWSANKKANDRNASILVVYLVTGSTNNWPDPKTTDADALTDAQKAVLRIGDTITLTNSSNKVETRYWSGTDWINIGVIIDGNLLVKGTVSADKINTQQLFADQALITKIQATAIDASKITSGTISADRLGAISISASQIQSDTLSQVNGMTFGFGANTGVTLNSVTYKGAGFFSTSPIDTFCLAAIHKGGGNAFAAGTYGNNPDGSAAIFSSGGTGGTTSHTVALLCGTDYENGITKKGAKQTAGAFAHVANGQYAYLGRADQAGYFKNSSVEVSLAEGAYGLSTRGRVFIDGRTDIMGSLWVNDSTDGQGGIFSGFGDFSGRIYCSANKIATYLNHYGKDPKGGTALRGVWSERGAVFNGDVAIKGAVYATGSFVGNVSIPFTGAHIALLSTSCTPQIGDLMVDHQAVAKRSVFDTVTEVVLSGAANQKGVVGVYSALDDSGVPSAMAADGDLGKYDARYEPWLKTHKQILVNSVGEGQINVCGEGGDLEIGDLIVSSSMPGKGMRQADDIVRSYTVAKCREKVTFTGPTEVKMVACIYLCG